MEDPAGKALFYTKTSEQADLFQSEMDGSNERLVLRGIAKRGFAVTAKRIYYLHQEADASVSLRALELPTGADTQLARLPDPLFLGLGLSPDARSVIYTRMRTQSNLMLAEGIFR